MQNPSLLPHYQAIFLPDILRIRDIQYISYICNCFLTQISHLSYVLNGSILICPSRVCITFVFTTFTFWPSISSALFKIISLRAVPSWSSSSNVHNTRTIYLVARLLLPRSQKHQSECQAQFVVYLVHLIHRRLP